MGNTMNSDFVSLESKKTNQNKAAKVLLTIFFMEFEMLHIWKHWSIISMCPQEEGKCDPKQQEPDSV